MARTVENAAKLDRSQLPEEQLRELERIETLEWLESLEYVIASGGEERVLEILDRLDQHARKYGVEIPINARTPYINTIPASEDLEYPGDLEIERKIRALIRWNAMAMVVRA